MQKWEENRKLIEQLGEKIEQLTEKMDNIILAESQDIPTQDTQLPNDIPGLKQIVMLVELVVRARIKDNPAYPFAGLKNGRDARAVLAEIEDILGRDDAMKEGVE